jgi:hypothetical protein
LVFIALTTWGNKPIKEVIKAIDPEIIIRDTFSSAQVSEIRFKGLAYSSQPFINKAPLM